MARRIEPIVCRYGSGAVVAYYVAAPRRTLIDTGGAQHPRTAIRAAVEGLGVGLGAIETIVNTHGHWDHAGGNAKVAAAARTEILIHEAGAPFLTDAERHLAGYFTASERLLEVPELVEAQRRVFPETFEPGPDPTRLLRDGDRIELGGGVAFDVLETPGHADDHVALWWEGEGVLIAGDAIQGTGSRPGSSPLYVGSVREARASLRRLREVPFRTLHVSHPFGRLGTGERATAYDAAGGRALIAESLAALDALEEAVGRAAREMPGSPFPRVARRATELLLQGGRWKVRPSGVTGVPANAAPTMHHLWREAVAG